MAVEELHQVATRLGRVQLRLSGQGPLLVCWPSLLMDGQLWRAQAAHFGGRYRVVSIDPPGHGGSEALRGHFDMDDCAEVLREILDALDAPDCALLGNSWGGMMGGVFAARHPQRLRAAVLMNCTASAVGLRQQLEFLLLAGLLRRSRRAPDWLVRRAVRAFAGETSEREKPAVVAEIRARVAAADPRSVHWAIRSVVPYRVDQHARLAEVRAPVLVVAGAEDRTFPVAETRRMAEAIPGARFEVLPGVGHLAALEAPERVNRLVEDFLREADPAFAG
ncbi:MAG: alpha/beta hydrolase [Stagnimonas sp.]|nr:alpha/beta hydrolase [Stagnimonas sp.]